MKNQSIKPRCHMVEMYTFIATLTFVSFTDKLFGFNLAIQFTPVSGVAGMYQMEQLLPTGPPRATCINRANPMRYSGGEGGRSSSLPPTHEPYLPLLPSCKASSPFGWYSLVIGTQRNGQIELTWVAGYILRQILCTGN